MRLIAARVLVAHELAFLREALVAALAAERPDLLAEEVDPARLDATLSRLATSCRPVVVCAKPSRSMQTRAHGWVVVTLEGAGVAFIGAGDAWRTVSAPRFAELVAATLSASTRRGSWLSRRQPGQGRGGDAGRSGDGGRRGPTP